MPSGQAGMPALRGARLVSPAVAPSGVGRAPRYFMEIEKLSERAMGIRQRFAEFEKARFGREWTKEEVMQGFVVDVGDLMKLVMAKSGIRDVAGIDQKLAHELSDCLWCVLVLSRMYGVDIASEFTKAMDELDDLIAAKSREPGRLSEPTDAGFTRHASSSAQSS